MRINTNIAALNGQRNLTNTNNAVQSSMQKLSSGYRINRAGDDAAGLSIANKMRADVRSLNMASKNVSQANSLLQIADGATEVMSRILDRMKELATQSSSDNVNNTDRTKIQAEFLELKSEITRLTDNTQYQGNKLLDGNFGVQNSTATGTAQGIGGVSNIRVSGATASTTYTLAQAAATSVTMTKGTSGTAGFVSQTITTTAGGAGQVQTLNFDKLGISFDYTGTLGAATLDTATVITTAAASAVIRVGTSASTDNEISLAMGNLTLTGLGLSASTLASHADAETALGAIDTALSTLASTSGTIGAAQNRLEFASTNLATMIQNVSAAESVIRDVDMAQEMTNFSKLQILSQAGTAMLAQANQMSQGVLQLLRG